MSDERPRIIIDLCDQFRRDKLAGQLQVDADSVGGLLHDIETVCQTGALPVAEAALEWEE